MRKMLTGFGRHIHVFRYTPTPPTKSVMSFFSGIKKLNPEYSMLLARVIEMTDTVESVQLLISICDQVKYDLESRDVVVKLLRQQAPQVPQVPQVPHVSLGPLVPPPQQSQPPKLWKNNWTYTDNAKNRVYTFILNRFYVAENDKFSVFLGHYESNKHNTVMDMRFYIANSINHFISYVNVNSFCLTWGWKTREDMIESVEKNISMRENQHLLDNIRIAILGYVPKDRNSCIEQVLKICSEFKSLIDTKSKFGNSKLIRMKKSAGYGSGIIIFAIFSHDSRFLFDPETHVAASPEPGEVPLSSSSEDDFIPLELPEPPELPKRVTRSTKRTRTVK